MMVKLRRLNLQPFLMQIFAHDVDIIYSYVHSPQELYKIICLKPNKIGKYCCDIYMENIKPQYVTY